MRIADATISHTHPPYIIAEIGGNHDGSLAKADELIRIAAEAGANAAKFQLYRAHDLYPGRHTPGAIPDRWLPVLQQTCREAGVEFLCSVFSLETLDAYLDLEPAAIKIASPEALNFDLLYAAASSGLPLIVATGACTISDVDGIECVLAGADHALLHCVSAYPAPPDHMNLAAIPRMMRRYRVPVGLSDHTITYSAAIYSAVLGASVIEKHLTTDRSLPGPDHPFALEPHEFATMTRYVAEARAMLGDGDKRVMPSEDPLDRRQIAA